MRRSSDAPCVALATYAAQPALTPDDRLLSDALSVRGVAAVARPWDAAGSWDAYAGVVLRSCWDFHHRPRGFLDWVDRVAVTRTTLLNPRALVHFNADKHYLQTLAAAGVPTVPTAWVERRPGAPALRAILAAHGWSRAVVKPAVSASAYETWRTSVDDARLDEHFGELVDRLPGGMMVQPFLPEIEDAGEWSLVFFSGVFSHAVVKRPAPGDFRVQADFGGSVEAHTPRAGVIADAARAIAAAAGAARLSVADVTYARVDGIERGGRLIVLELECIEPVLFFRYAPGSADWLAHVIVERVHDPSRAPA
jgi:glutathione synthase/RimK-type ligase-like ATP-grasp enzyme